MSSQDQQKEMAPIHFGKFNVTSQVFHTTPLSFAVVNLKPLLPGHILVSPLRSRPRLSDLTRDEVSDLFLTVTRVQRTLQRVYRAEAFNVAVQDGEAAGQSVPHVHCHVIPRVKGDSGEGDKVHEWLEGEEGDVGRHQEESAGERKSKEWAKDEERKPRSMEEMVKEARWLREEMERDALEDGGSGRL
nr:bis(5'-nucleosyl)-tetraphosphatase [asymmetrical] [Quercus suber]